MMHCKKTTISLPPGLHRRLRTAARRRQVTLEQLVRSVCESRFGRASRLGAPQQHAAREAVERFLE
jgi:predicted DNA-binding ribbon-helix-helix protein